MGRGIQSIMTLVLPGSYLTRWTADILLIRSYNQLNETYASQHCRLLHDIMNTELGFKGYIQSDWWAQKEDIPS